MADRVLTWGDEVAVPFSLTSWSLVKSNSQTAKKIGCRQFSTLWKRSEAGSLVVGADHTPQRIVHLTGTR